MGLEFLEVGLGTLFFAGACLVTALGARAWSQAVSAAHTARAHGIQADETQETLQQAREAVVNATRQTEDDYRKPTHDELLEAIYAERHSGNGELDPEFNTSGDANIPDEVQQHMSGGEYAT